MSVVTFPTNTTTLLVNTLFTSKIVYLPPIRTANPGTVYFIKDICGNAAVSSIYIYANGTDTIEKQNAGTASALLNANFGSIMLTPDGLSNWMILQHYNTNTVVKLWRYLPSTPIGLTLTLNPSSGYLLATWTPTPYTNTYTITFYQNTTPTTGGATTLQTYSGLTSLTAVTTSALTSAYYYYYSLVGTNTLGNSSTVLSPFIQATLYPAPPTNVAISYVYPNLNITWSASATATSYSVVIYNLLTSTTSGGTPFQIITGVTGTSSSSTNPLVYGYFYSIVYSLNAYGYSSPATSASTAFVAIPNITSGVMTFSGNQVTATWTANPTGTYSVIFYEVVTQTTTGGRVLESYSGLTGYSQTSVSALTNAYYYYAIITGTNAVGTSAPFTTSNAIQASIFAVGGSIVLNSGLTTTGGSVTITAATGATNYTVYISTTTSSANSVYSFTTTTTGSAVAFTTTLSINTTYYAVLLPSNIYGIGTYSYSAGVTTPAIPVGGSIVLNSGLTTTGGSVTIAAATNATNYTVYISTTTSSANSVYSFTTTTTGSAVAFTTTLSANTTYYAVLLPSNIYASGTYSYSAGVATPPSNLLYSYSGTLTFTPAGATGQNGPTLSQCTTAYSSFGSWVSNTAYFNMTTQGIQQWTVPSTRTYTITCAGAGYTAPGTSSISAASGAILTATFSLTLGQIIYILVGQKGTGDGAFGGGGSGGSFVATSSGTALIVAGGAGQPNGVSTVCSASLTTSGLAGSAGAIGGASPSPGGSGGSSGGGGGAGGSDSYTAGAAVIIYGGAGGGGFTGNGTSGPAGTYANGGLSYTNGGVGGSGYTSFYTTNTGGVAVQFNGGFGGGGAGAVWFVNGSVNGAYSDGGGGGYSGGGGGGGGNGVGAGGGGGSYCSVSLTSSSVTNTGNGYVSIT
jgi:hypothetical protein